MKFQCQRCGSKEPVHACILDVKPRLSIDDYFMGMLNFVKLRASCPRRQGAAILVDSRNRLISTGYNGPGEGIDNCITHPCRGRWDESGNTTRCIAVHAEANALLQARDRLDDAVTMYCTTRPCFNCCKLLTNTLIKRVVFNEEYPDQEGLDLLQRKGIILEQYV